MGLQVYGQRARLKFVILLGMCIAFAFLTAMGSLYTIRWLTNGVAWFTLFGFEFHKISVVFGVIVGAMFLGGGSVSVNRR